MNKQEMVKAFHEEGFNEITMESPLSLMAEYIRWMGGLRDLTLACVRKTDSENVFFTEAEWNSMSANNKSRYVKIGVRIRARKRSFIIAKDDAKAADGNITFKFGCTDRDLKGVQNYGSINSGLYDIASGIADTKAAIDQSADQADSSGIIGAPACEAAWNYSAASEDKNQWYLPSVSELRLISEFRKEINSFISKMFSSENLIILDWYWSSTEYNSSYSWHVHMVYGSSCYHSRSGAYRVRPVCSCSSADHPL